jgi:ABC-type cobalamin transport system permease subunit
MSENPMKVASRRYSAGVLGAMSLYAVALVVSIRWLQHNPSPPWKYVIAVLPVLPALWIPIAAVRFLREMDELQRRIQLESLALGFTSAAALTLTYGFLQNAGLPDLSWVWVWPVMGVCWLIGLAVSRRRYR